MPISVICSIIQGRQTDTHIMFIDEPGIFLGICQMISWRDRVKSSATFERWKWDVDALNVSILKYHRCGRKYIYGVLLTPT